MKGDGEDDEAMRQTFDGQIKFNSNVLKISSVHTAIQSDIAMQRAPIIRITGTVYKYLWHVPFEASTRNMFSLFICAVQSAHMS